jgi:hypothetical protein
VAGEHTVEATRLDRVATARGSFGPLARHTGMMFNGR